MNRNDPILEFRDVSVACGGGGAGDLCDVSFSGSAGECIAVLLEEECDYFPLADLAQGILPPDRGQVRFLGEDWALAPASRQAELRGKTGRVFERQGWVSNLSIRENVLLSQLHHTRRREGEILAEAERLAVAAGLTGVPDERPDAVSAADRRRLEWVRAFLGAPHLVLLERPEVGAPRGSMERLLRMAETARGQGALVIWTTADREARNRTEGPSVRRACVRGGRLEWETRAG